MTKVPEKDPAAIALGRRGGQANTAAQNRARRKNIKLGGRPRRVCVHCGQPVKGGHLDRSLDHTCGEHGWRWERTLRKAPKKNIEGRALDAIAAALRLDIEPAYKLMSIATLVRRTGRRTAPTKE